MKTLKRSSAVVIPLLAIVFLSACGGSVSLGEDQVSSGDIEAEATKVLTAEAGEAPKSIECPDDLDAEKGESETCVLTDKQGNTYDMTATIVSMKDDTANFNFKVGNKN